MDAVWLFAGDDGRSHFADIEIPLRTYELGRISKLLPLEGIVFRETVPTYNLGFHNAPRPQIIIHLTGASEIETGDGTKRILGPASILVVEDVEGEGHKTREVESPRITIFLPLTGPFDFNAWRK